MRNQKSGAVALFIGILLIVIFGVGLAVERDPGALMRRNSYNIALEQFGSFWARFIRTAPRIFFIPFSFPG